MALGQVKTNPVGMTVNEEVVGKDMSFFTVDYINAINASQGPLGALQAVYNTIIERWTVVAVGPLLDTNTQQTFAIEGVVEAAHITALQVAIRALGTVDGVDLSSATVTATKLGILTAAVVA